MVDTNWYALFCRSKSVLHNLTWFGHNKVKIFPTVQSKLVILFAKWTIFKFRRQIPFGYFALGLLRSWTNRRLSVCKQNKYLIIVSGTYFADYCFNLLFRCPFDITREGKLSAGSRLVLPQSADFDHVNCACVADLDFDGLPEIVVGTFGQQLLFYKWISQPDSAAEGSYS